MAAKTKSKQKTEYDLQQTSSGIKRRKFADRIATGVVTTGGIAIILSILAILFFIGLVTIPLWEGVKSSLTSSFVLKETPDLASYTLADSNEDEYPFLAVGTDSYKEMVMVVTRDGMVYFLSLEDGSVVNKSQLADLEDVRITSSFVAVNNRLYSFGLSDGNILPVAVNYKLRFEDENRIITPVVEQQDIFNVSDSALKIIAYEDSQDGSGSAAAAYTADRQLLFASVADSSSGGLSLSLSGPGRENTFSDLTDSLGGSVVTTIELDYFLQNLFVGTKDGKIFHWNVGNKKNPELLDVIDATSGPDVAVTSLAFLLGDRSLVVGDGEGRVSVWFEVPDEDSPRGKILKRIHELEPMELPITYLTASARDRGFLASDTKGNINVYHTTSGQLLDSVNTGNSRVQRMSFAPKANGVIAINDEGKLFNWNLRNNHPETNLKTLFGKVWYEGYSQPEYVWQSTGGSDEFEPKLSLTPLAFGTIKGAIYALLFAIPLSILSALCVSQFMHSGLRNVIKPSIEIMAALPTVVLGFFAGLWLAPRIERVIPAVFTVPIVVTLFTLISVIVWQKLPRGIRGRFRVGSELFLLIPVIILGVIVSFWLNAPIEKALFGGDYKTWLYQVMGLQYDQRNSLIVGFAMGFAVIPIIFTISEDALSSVPKHLQAGSLALGANRWQTAIRVILPTASPGIFSAVMIGLGRAIGETMIVLMATGNTPIMDWSIFNGFRALSANIAVEIPEAPHGGTLYRVLFLAALLLFFFTFFVNTIAEIVRQRLRKKYGQL